MKTFKIAQMVPLVLIAATSFAQGDNRAVPRGGGGGGSDSGSRHTGGGGSSSGSSSSSSSGSNYSGGSSSSDNGRYDSSAPGAAQRRPRPGTGTGDRDRYGNHYRGNSNSYYYYDPYAYSWGGSYARPYGYYGYGYGYNDYGFGYGDYYGYYPSVGYRSYRYRSNNVAQLRTLVEPSKTRVYVDGYYAGEVDDFDGLLQRLNVSPGRHDITFRLEGYKSHTFSVYANRDQTLKLRWDMAKGSGETRDSIGEDNGRMDERERELDRDRRDDRYDDERERDNVERYDDARERRDPSREVDNDRRTESPLRIEGREGRGGEVFFEIEPPDASIYVDGEFFGKAAQVTRLELAAGRHRIEVVRPGFKTEETEVEVGGDAKKVVVRLERR